MNLIIKMEINASNINFFFVQKKKGKGKVGVKKYYLLLFALISLLWADFEFVPFWNSWNQINLKFGQLRRKLCKLER